MVEFYNTIEFLEWEWEEKKNIFLFGNQTYLQFAFIEIFVNIFFFPQKNTMLKNNQIFPSLIIAIDKLFLMYVFTCVVSCIFPYLMAIVMQISKRDIGEKIF